MANLNARIICDSDPLLGRSATATTQGLKVMVLRGAGAPEWVWGT